MDIATEFYRSQIGGDSVISYGYTDDPGKLLLKDIYYFFKYCWALPWIVWPLSPCSSGPLAELYPSTKNIFCIFIHVILIILQLAFLCGGVLMFIFPMWMSVFYVAGFALLNWMLSRMLNGRQITYTSDEKYAKAKPEHAHEQWIFLNGVAVGEHWMKNNLNRLALTFGRPILGVHNRTSGIIFDVIECLIQRNCSYATDDVRLAYRIVKEALYDTEKTKVVFILHSQGGIEGGLVLDWLLQEMPQDLLSKLEVYTFGNAANHFNNPHRRLESQRLTSRSPVEAIATLMTETSYTTPSSSPVESRNPGPLTLTSQSSQASTRTLSAAKDRAIGHIEHYAHNTDFVAIWGVLHFSTNRMQSPQLPRFLGRLFNRSTRRGGHQMNQHYMDGMFPLKKDPETGEFIGADDNNPFMEEIIKFGTEGAAMDNAREAFDITYAGTHGFGTGAVSTPVEVHGAGASRRDRKKDIRVKDVSRLWLYRNGRSPAEMTAVVEGVVRTITM